MRKFTWHGIALIAAIFITIELYARSGMINPAIFPSPTRVLATFGETEFLAQALGQAATTLIRAAFGFFLSLIIAVPIGLAMGTVPAIRSAATPLVELLRPIPSSAMVPVAILFLGLGSNMIIFVIWFGTLWPMLMNSMYGAQGINPRHRELASLLKLSKLKYLLLIVIPTATPSIFAGIRISTSIALILAVTAEMLAGQDGIGFYLLDYERAFRYRQMFAVLVILALIGLALNALLVSMQRLLIRRFPSLS